MVSRLPDDSLCAVLAQPTSQQGILGLRVCREAQRRHIRPCCKRVFPHKKRIQAGAASSGAICVVGRVLRHTQREKMSCAAKGTFPGDSAATKCGKISVTPRCCVCRQRKAAGVRASGKRTPLRRSRRRCCRKSVSYTSPKTLSCPQRMKTMPRGAITLKQRVKNLRPTKRSPQRSISVTTLSTPHS